MTTESHHDLATFAQHTPHVYTNKQTHTHLCARVQTDGWGRVEGLQHAVEAKSRAEKRRF